MTTTTYTVNLEDAGPVDVTVNENGAGQPFLLLHGGGGPDTTARFGERLATTGHLRVLNPVHPGFGGTPRPEALHTVGGLAALYVALLDQLGLEDVTVAGNSVGGWIAAEMAILNSPRIRRVILIDPVGMQVPEHPPVEFFSLRMDQVFPLSFHNPAPFAIDPATLPPAAQQIGAANRAALITYSGRSDDGRRPHPPRAPRRRGDPDPGAVGRQRPDRHPRVRPRLGRRHPEGPVRGAQGHRAHAPARDARPGARGAPLTQAAAPVSPLSEVKSRDCHGPVRRRGGPMSRHGLILFRPPPFTRSPPPRHSESRWAGLADADGKSGRPGRDIAVNERTRTVPAPLGEL